MNTSLVQALGSYPVGFSLMVNGPSVLGPVKVGSPSAMNTSSSIIQFQFISSVIFAFNKVTEHSLKDPLHSIPLSQLDSTYQFKHKHKPILTLQIIILTWYPA